MLILLGISGLFFALGCGDVEDDFDAAASDAALAADAEPLTDATWPDAEPPDAALPDAEPPDAALPDAMPMLTPAIVCEHLCTALVACFGIEYDDCFAGCSTDLVDCTDMQLETLDACQNADCMNMQDCIIAVPCVNG